MEETDFETLSGWEQLRYNAENGQLAVIGMESLPDLYTGISEFRQEKSGAVSAVIDQEDIIRYDADGNRIEGYAFPVAYRDKGGEHPLIKSAQELFDKMADEPKGTFELTEDLDASGDSCGCSCDCRHIHRRAGRKRPYHIRAGCGTL